MLKRFFWTTITVALIAIWSLNALIPHFTPKPALEMWMLNVGQGESVLLREPQGHTILYDGGPTDAVLSEIGSLLPIWTRSIDLIILSHNHTDHLRGIISVLQRYTVKQLWWSGALDTTPDYKAFIQTMATRHVTPQLRYWPACQIPGCVSTPPTYFLGALTLSVFHPLQNMSGVLPKDQHDATLSVKVSYKQQSIFLAGDLHEGHEADILEHCHPPTCSLKTTILQVPHHGSSTGLLPEFLAALNPQVALIPVGLDNSYGHPAGSTLQKLAFAHIPTYRTDLQGRIHVVLYGNRYTVETTRGP